MPQRRKVIALILPPHIAYSRGITQGVIDCHLETRGWMLIELPRLASGQSPLPEEEFQLDGAILWSEPRDTYVKELVARGVPVINCGMEWGDEPGVVRVHPEPEDLHVKTIEHFTQLGLRHLLVLGHRLAERPGTRAVLEQLARIGRQAGMTAEIREIGGIEGPAFSPQRLLGFAREPQLRLILRQLPKPAAVFCSGDHMGYMVCAVAEQYGFRVPEDLAIMGSGGETVGYLSHPPLTSITAPTREIGRAAAQLMIQWLECGKAPASEVVVRGAELIERESTVGKSGRVILEGVRRFIEERAVKGLGLGDLEEVSGLSAKTLTTQYTAAFGIKPLDEAQHRRIGEAKCLLADKALPITDIAARCGFTSQAGFYNYFKRHTGISPSNFRSAAAPEMPT